jgi:hypothetical protein
MMIFGEAVTKANAKKTCYQIQNRNCWIISSIYFRSFVVLMKWNVIGYYWDKKQHYIIYQNEDGQTKMESSSKKST